MSPMCNDSANSHVSVAYPGEIHNANRSGSVHVWELDPLQDSRWVRLIETHPSASVFHSVAWLKALRSVYGYDPVAISTSRPSEPLTNGLVFCRINSWLTGPRMVSLPFSDHCDALVKSPSELDCLLQYTKGRVDGDAWKYMEVRPTSATPGSDTGFGRTIPYCFHRLDLRKSTAELFRNFHKDCVQRKIRRAERESLSYEEGRSELLLMKFYRLLLITRRRKNLPPQPLAWFRALIAEFGGNLKIRVASKDSTPVASIITLSFGRCVTYKYGCSDARYSKLGGTALLFWKTIQDAKDHEFEELDLGRSAVDNGGLIAFKERWGATRTVANYWRYPSGPLSRRDDWTVRLAHRAFSVAPDSVLVALGNLLYRHIG
jgi:hypothetical protein